MGSRNFSCNSVLQIAPFFWDFKLHCQSHCSEGCYWPSHPRPVPHGTCSIDLAGSSITYIKKWPSAQPKCLLKGQHDGT